MVVQRAVIHYNLQVGLAKFHTLNIFEKSLSYTISAQIIWSVGMRNFFTGVGNSTVELPTPLHFTNIYTCW